MVASVATPHLQQHAVQGRVAKLSMYGIEPPLTALYISAVHNNIAFTTNIPPAIITYTTPTQIVALIVPPLL